MASKISLGTVQFGQDYGIANTQGRISESEVGDILDYAQSVGICTIDTAHAYGESEYVIGQYLRKRTKNLKIISKLPSIESYQPGEVEKFLEQSLQCLGVKQLYGYFLHEFNDILKFKDLWNEFICLKENGTVKKIGISLYSPDELAFLLDKEIDFDIVQLPYSIFDQRFEKYLGILKKKEIEIQIRSVFLQGLAFLGPGDLPVSLREAKPKLEQLQRIAQEQNISIAGLCLNFACLNSHIDQVLIGVDSLNQLKNNVESLKFENNVKNIINQLKDLRIDQDNILLPYKWKINYAQI